MWRDVQCRNPGLDINGNPSCQEPSWSVACSHAYHGWCSGWTLTCCAGATITRTTTTTTTTTTTMSTSTISSCGIEQPATSQQTLGYVRWAAYQGCTGPDENIDNCAGFGGCKSGVSLAKCSEACAKTSLCGAFNHNGNWCFLKKSKAVYEITDMKFLYCRQWAVQNGFTFYVKPCSGRPARRLGHETEEASPTSVGNALVLV